MISVFINDIFKTLLDAGLKAEIVSFSLSAEGKTIQIQSILCIHYKNNSKLRILPVDICDNSPQSAEKTQASRVEALNHFKSLDGVYPLIISRDRWERQRELTVARLLSHLGIYQQIYARNCEVKRIDKPTAAQFLDMAHSYGDASCRYRYGLYLKRHTGHLSHSVQEPIAPGTLVAVATFSGARRWQKGEKIIRSYEWTRYASLPGLRLSGGMGKLLKHFIKEENPDDIMSYADLEWSEGAVYEGLGFESEGYKAPVLFAIDSDTWQRIPVHKVGHAQLYHQNFGSFKYRLMLTEYQ